MPISLRRRAAPAFFCAVVLGAVVACAPALAAQYDAAEFQSLLSQAQSRGAVRVMVALDVDVGLGETPERTALIKTVVPARASALLLELGDTAWTAGRWNNGLGQMGLYLTPAGLQYLAASANARSFMRDPTDKMRRRLWNGDGRLDAIERDLDAQGWSDVQVTLNTESLDFDVMRDRSVRFRAMDLPETANARRQLLDSLGDRHAMNLAAARRVTALSPVMGLRVTREGYHLLREDGQVRGMRPAAFSDARAAQFSPAALAAAKSQGSAEVLVELRGGDAYTPSQGFLPARAWKNQMASVTRAFAEILGPGVADGVLHRQDFSEVGAVVLHLSHAALARLYQDADPRILRVRLNEPVATAGLATSEALINMPQAWNAGHRAAGQTIVVLDSGVKKNHEFFKMNGASKVTFEFCAGSNSLPYKSICPAPNAFGDSPLNYPGSGEPVSIAACPATSSTFPACTHGTHVAGIAAGRKSTLLPTGLQGVAPDAYIVSAQVFSFDPSNKFAPTIYRNDMLAALQAVHTSTASDGYTVNLSVWWSALPPFASDCAAYDQGIEDSIALLYSRNIPIVVITGNGSSLNGVSWPACTPNTIKVAATNNGGTGNSVNGGSNVGNPASYSGALFLAPGYNVVSSVTSGTTATQAYGGTSMAAPHVAGYYATIKAASPGISIADATAWIVATGSVPVSYAGYQFRRIRAPSF
ncbi:MAG: S8 family serine peptidase [Pseudomonadota bacterium]